MKVSELVTLLSAHLPADEEMKVVIGYDETTDDLGVSLMAGDRALKVVGYENREPEVEEFGGLKITTVKTLPITKLEVLASSGHTLLESVGREE